MTRRCVALAAVALLVARAAAAEAPCRTRVLVEPASAFVGEQILYRLQIFRRLDVASVRFARDLSFPSFRAEWLPGQSPDPAINEIGDHALVFEERRALFPARAGDLAIPAARLACVVGEQTLEVDVPAARVQVRELPDADRPPGFRGVVGRVNVQAHLSSDRIALGQSLALAVMVRGAANAWDAGDPLDPARDLAGIDVYAHPPTTERETGRHLEVRRAFTFDLVPRAIGRFEIPPLRVPYFDPVRERYEIAETAALPFTVEAAAGEALRPAAPTSSPSEMPRRSFGARGVGALLVATAIGVGIAMLRRRLRRRAVQRAAAALLADAARASARGDAAATASALTAALRAALEARVPGAGALAAEEIAAHEEASLRAVGVALVELDRVRFGAAPERGRAPDPQQVRALIASL